MRTSAYLATAFYAFIVLSTEVLQTSSYYIDGMISDVDCGDVEYTLQCICSELRRYPVQRLTVQCPWRTHRNTRSVTDGGREGSHIKDFKQIQVDPADSNVTEQFHPRNLEYINQLEVPRVRTKRQYRIAFVDECCNIRTEHFCNATTVALYCVRYY